MTLTSQWGWIEGGTPVVAYEMDLLGTCWVDQTGAQKAYRRDHGRDVRLVAIEGTPRRGSSDTEAMASFVLVHGERGKALLARHGGDVAAAEEALRALRLVAR